jgi:hypothetical protein
MMTLNNLPLGIFREHKKYTNSHFGCYFEALSIVGVLPYACGAVTDVIWGRYSR